MSNQRTRNRAPGTPTASPFRIPTAVVVGIVVAVVGIAVVLALVLGGDDSGDDGGVDQTRPVTVQGTPLPPADASGTVDPAVGEAAPVLEGENFAGEKVTIGDDGRAKAIFFVAHWCPHCQAEVPIVKEYLDDPGLPDGVDLYIVPTSTDQDLPNYPPSTWLEEEGVGDVPTLVDDDQSTAHAAYGNGNFPNLVLVGADGNVAARFSGELGADAYPQLFDALAAGDPIPGAIPGPSSNTPA
jgi:thiol-disulfide isomerase/thioredoxin